LTTFAPLIGAETPASQGQGQQRVSLASGLLRRAPRSIPRAQGAARLARKVS